MTTEPSAEDVPAYALNGTHLGHKITLHNEASNYTIDGLGLIGVDHALDDDTVVLTLLTWERQTALVRVATEQVVTVHEHTLNPRSS